MPNLTELRNDIYNLVDQVIETGKPLAIERKGHRLKIVLDEPLRGSKLARLVKRDNVMLEDPENYVHVDWTAEWKDDLS